jgi:hypothetical protein
MKILAIAFSSLFQTSSVISNQHWMMHSVALQLMPVITAYLERGSAAAMILLTAWAVQSVRNRIASQRSARFPASGLCQSK